MYEIMNYEKAEKLYGLKNHNRKCIDGHITGCGNCVGYCSYCEHSGFLTKELRKEHNCIGKQCHHYIEKRNVRNEKGYNPFDSILKSWENSADAAFKLACSLTKDFEGMRFMKANLLDDLICELSYITLSNDYELSPIINQIEKETGVKVKTKRLNYSFDNVVRLIMEKVYA